MGYWASSKQSRWQRIIIARGLDGLVPQLIVICQEGQAVLYSNSGFRINELITALEKAV